MKKEQTQDPVELQEVQGIIIKGYARLKEAKFLMLHFNNPAGAGQWLAAMLNEITTANISTREINTAVNLAFTYSGIATFKIPEEAAKTFPVEFVEGIITEHRSRMLGDLDDSAPDKWEWGSGKDPKPIHVLLMLYAVDNTAMQELLANQKAKWEANGLQLLYQLDTIDLPEMKEHFGFRDGIAQPVVKNINHESDHEANEINTGEFLFGYRNEYDKYTFSPTINPANDPANILAADKNDNQLKDLGRNGSMLVFRQLEQDVKAFWNMADEQSKKLSAQHEPMSAEYLAAKMVGRWPNGSPLTKCPHQPDDSKSDFDNFGYAKSDYDGFKCPIGSHIRRTNPRDNFVRDSTGNKEKDIEKSMKFMKRFRILRRGRYYGPPLVASMNPQDIMNTSDDGKKRGLYFLCFNSNIERQYELIQQTWVNNPKFAGLYNDPDPLTGDPGILGKGATSTFTIQTEPVRKQVQGINRFVHVKGGAYFFMPGIKSLRYLCSL